MPQIGIQTGVKLLDGAFAESFPVNLEHIVINSGVSEGQLETTRGATTLTTGPGRDRGGIMWNGIMYRVMGTKLVSVVGSTVNVLGDVGGTGPVRMDYSFDRLAVASDGLLFYWTGSVLEQVTDPNLGTALDIAWTAGYFVTTDGTSIVVTELLDPLLIDPLKYGSAEADPDSITGVEVINQEVYALGRDTIQIFRNAGGIVFPFLPIIGATIPFGCISAHAKCRVIDSIAFVGGGREEPLGVFVVSGGTALRVSTREIEELFVGVVESLIKLEARRFGDDDHLILHTPNGSAMLKIRTSSEIGGRLWTLLYSGRGDEYRLRYAVWDGTRHVVGDTASAALGVLNDTIAEHFGAKTEQWFDAGLIFNDGRGVIVNELELFGQFPLGRPSNVFVSVTRDGETYSNEVSRALVGLREQRCIWRPGVRLPYVSGWRFRFTDRVAIARCEVMAEPLAA